MLTVKEVSRLKETAIRFFPGQVVATFSALSALQDAGGEAFAYLKRHLAGDWGEMKRVERETNERAIREQARILSRYALASGVEILIITEYDRSVTTFCTREDL
jgi:hypothetical protein